MKNPWPPAREPRCAEPVAAGVSDSAPTAVVLGGTGCIGRHICAAFARQGYRVVTVTRRPAPRVAPHPHRRLDLETAQPAALRAVFDDERADVVVNATDMAGATDATGAADGGEARAAELLDANEGLARRLVEALSGAARGPRLIHIGTIHEYGPGESGVPLHEDIEPAPANAYARAKLAGSQVVLDAARAGAVSAVVLRLVNTCGPYPTPAGFAGKLLPVLLAAAAADEPPSITVGGAMRDWIDVRDVAEAAVLAARRRWTATPSTSAAASASPCGSWSGTRWRRPACPTPGSARPPGRCAAWAPTGYRPTSAGPAPCSAGVPRSR